MDPKAKAKQLIEENVKWRGKLSSSRDQLANHSYDFPTDKDTVLLVWTTTEKCYECTTRYLMSCLDSGCNIPSKSVVHYGWFPTVKAALDEATANQWNVSSVYAMTPLKFTRKESEKREPQPDKITPHVSYETKEGDK